MSVAGRGRRRKNRRRSRALLDGLRSVARAAAGVLALAGVVGAALGVTLWVRDHAYFVLREIEVSGSTEPQLVREWTGLVPGTSSWRVDARAVEARLERQARIAKADVFRELPDRVYVVVEERFPVALLQPQSPLFVDEHGVVFPPLAGESTDGLPWISGLTVEDLTAEPAWASARLREAAALIRGWARHPDWPRISEVRPEARGELVVFPESVKLTVRFGVTPADDAFERLATVFAQWEGSEASLSAIDLTVPGQAILRMRRSGRAPATPRQPI